MLIKNSKISIFDRNTDLLKYEFGLVNSVIINSSRNEFTDTATVIMPNRLRRKNNQIKFEINIGDRIVIELGYKPDLVTEFDGYINKVDPDSPMVLECEDQMFKLKKQSLESFVLKDTTLVELINKVYSPEIAAAAGLSGEVSVVDAPIGTFKVDKNQTTVDVFNALRKTFNTFIFFQDGVLNVHILIPSQINSTILFHSQKNVPQDSENVDFQTDTDGNVVAYGLSEHKDGTKVEVFAFYLDNLPDNEIVVSTDRPLGTLNKFKVPNRTQSQMDNLVRQWLPNLWYTGAIGDISTFGAPTIKHGDVARLRNDKFPDRDGDYRITAVNKEFSVSNGYKQRVTLGLKISD